MKIKVEHCWGSDFYFRCTLPNGDRFNIKGDQWKRPQAKAAKDYVEQFYKVKRQNIRFI